MQTWLQDNRGLTTAQLLEMGYTQQTIDAAKAGLAFEIPGPAYDSSDVSALQGFYGTTAPAWDAKKEGPFFDFGDTSLPDTSSTLFSDAKKSGEFVFDDSGEEEMVAAAIAASSAVSAPPSDHKESERLRARSFSSDSADSVGLVDHPEEEGEDASSSAPKTGEGKRESKSKGKQSAPKEAPSPASAGLQRFSLLTMPASSPRSGKPVATSSTSITSPPTSEDIVKGFE